MCSRRRVSVRQRFRATRSETNRTVLLIEVRLDPFPIPSDLQSSPSTHRPVAPGAATSIRHTTRTAQPRQTHGSRAALPRSPQRHAARIIRSDPFLDTQSTVSDIPCATTPTDRHSRKTDGRRVPSRAVDDQAFAGGSGLQKATLSGRPAGLEDVEMGRRGTKVVG
jgi:hypothetical protein